MSEPCDICHSQPCRPDCPDPVDGATFYGGGLADALAKNFVTARQLGNLSPFKAKGYSAIQDEVDMVSRLCDLVGKSAAMAVLREFRVTKREV